MGRPLTRGRAGRLKRGAPCAAALTILVATCVPAAGQRPASPTLRWGSGYLDVPGAFVLPSAGVRAGFSGFWSSVPGPPQVDGTGAVVGTGASRERFHGDLWMGLGLVDRFELGASLQSVRSEEEGGDLWGFHGRVLLLRPDPGGLGLAVGARLLTIPDFPDGVEGAPSRLGLPDPRLRRRYEDGIEVRTRFSPWAVATWAVPGPRPGWLPDNDLTVTAGWGGGIFREGEELAWYAGGVTDGWLVAGSWAFALAEDATLALEAEHAGMDVNAGLELNWRGARLGVHALGLNHRESVSVYRSRRWGLSASLEACPLLRRACRPRVRRPEVGDTIRLPAPPPDTVRVRVPVDTMEIQEPSRAAEAGPRDRPVRLCLATGQDLWVRAPDPDAVELGPDRAEGSYAGVPPPETLEHGGLRYLRVGEPMNPLCASLESAGTWRGIPLHGPRGGDGTELLLPLAPGRWQPYRAGTGG